MDIARTVSVDAGASAIIAALEQHGYEAYVVGGCVRDSLMGLLPKDWDITTSAEPEEIKAVFAHTFDTGIEHGTVSVRERGETYEVTTYRIDGQYEDHRRPDSVTFTRSLDEDLARRDFTVNAMAFHPERGLVDLFDGVGDLERGIIRAVGCPNERFEEDALRMLRAVRFAARFGFEIEPVTYAAIGEKAPTLEHVSAERIASELNQMLVGPRPEYIEKLTETGLMAYAMPGFELNSEDLKLVAKLSAEKKQRWAGLLFRMTPDEAGTLLKELKFDNATRLYVEHMLKWKDESVPTDAKGMRRFLSGLGREYFPDLIGLREGFGECFPRRVKRLYRKEKNRALSVKELAVSGKDLLEAGFPGGKSLGLMLDALLGQVLDRPRLNRKDKLLKIARRLG